MDKITALAAAITGLAALTLISVRTIHNLDSIGLQFAKRSGAIDYYRYALDINYLQEQLRSHGRQ